MYYSYSIEQALKIMPYVSIGLIVIILVFMEIKTFREAHADSPFDKDDESDGFTFPPGDDGYEYYPKRGVKVYLVKKASNRYRVYLMEGEADDADGIKFKRDRYGRYVTLRAGNAGTAEKITDRIFGG